ncbi:MAG: 1-acyl-sn-glycerol-3-phosphate acyltransferase [Actinobacteria bacterium]|nr:MAG: 1-acyl-sn-glycerol-3-phosphate acyltransferase [Actinomycetota bacterium]
MSVAGWTPMSGCGAHCLSGDQAPGVGLAVRVGRLVALLVVVLGAAVVSPVLPLLPYRWRARMVRGCARNTLRALGIRWRVRGRLPAHKALVVANHVSWLDIVVILAAGGARLVAKSEVRGWPVVGRIAAYTGAFFVDRSRPRTLPSTVDSVGVALAGGAVVAVFPEGTTSCGEGVGSFRPAFFQAAVASGACVVPLTLTFTANGEPTTQPAFIGEDTLVASLNRVLALRGLSVGLSFGTAIHPAAAASRRTLAWIAGKAVTA